MDLLLLFETGCCYAAPRTIRGPLRSLCLLLNKQFLLRYQQTSIYQSPETVSIQSFRYANTCLTKFLLGHDGPSQLRLTDFSLMELGSFMFPFGYHRDVESLTTMVIKAKALDTLVEKNRSNSDRVV